MTEPINLTMKYVKSTVNMHRYEEDPMPDRYGITLYLRKADLGEESPPATIEVTVEVQS